MLTIQGLHSGYGSFEVLRGIGLAVEKGEITAIVGRNGAGKTTLAMTISGLLRAGAGRICVNGENITHLPSWEIARRGIAFVPEGRRIFPDMSVLENLELGGHAPLILAENVESLFALFPQLGARARQKAGTLAGGEQKMLTIARALMGCPRVLVLDEPSQGLASAELQQLFAAIRTVNRERQMSVLLLEQNAFQALRLADSAYALSNGCIDRKRNALEALADRRVQSEYLGGLPQGQRP